MSPEDADSFIDLEQLVAAARRQVKVVALCAVLGLAMGIVYLVFTPRVYTATTDILLDDSLTRFAEEKDNTSAHIQADAMVLSEVEILKSSRLARAVVVAAKLNENQAFLNPPRSPLDWLKDQVRGADASVRLVARRQIRAVRSRTPRSGGQSCCCRIR